jgi:hypothetical protein
VIIKTQMKGERGDNGIGTSEKDAHYGGSI